MPHLIPMMGTTDQTIPGFGGIGLPTAVLNNGGAGEGSTVRADMEHMALITNPQGVYNNATGTWDPPPGQVCKYWYEPRRYERERSTPAAMTSSCNGVTRTSGCKPLVNLTDRLSVKRFGYFLTLV
ncbi:hypothetical protein ON010_g10469 [Phytophthora cinnamomi]|nr:hypothetical protein ON010_g10469 [Phytophthora cinnamomi]